MTVPLQSQTMALPRTRGGISYVEREGGGPVVVFLHGIGSNASSFAGLFAVLPRAYRLIAWNAPGYGGSTPLAADWPVAADYADALADFLDALDIASCILVGHSLGTLMGAAFAKAHPDRVSHLVLAACAQGYAIAPGASIPEGVAKRITDLQELGPRAFAATRAARLVHDPATAPQVVALVEANMAQIDPSGYAQAVRMLASGDLAGSMIGLQTPCSFIIGAQDHVTPEAQTLRAASAWAGEKRAPDIIRIPDAGHAVYVQEPDAFATALAGILAQNGASQ